MSEFICARKEKRVRTLHYRIAYSEFLLEYSKLKFFVRYKRIVTRDGVYLRVTSSEESGVSTAINYNYTGPMSPERMWKHSIAQNCVPNKLDHRQNKDFNDSVRNISDATSLAHVGFCKLLLSLFRQITAKFLTRLIF